jgi:hypothetical protein
MGRAYTNLSGYSELQRWAESVCAVDVVIEDPDKEEIQRRYPMIAGIGDPFEMKQGPLQGRGRFIRRKLTSSEGVLFTILYSDGQIREWEWFD